MPPKKAKGRKRASTDDDKTKESPKMTKESTDLLSPSEVVKMRKKSRISLQEPANAKEQLKEKEVRTSGKIKGSRSLERANKKEKVKDAEKKKEIGKNKKEKNEKENESKKIKVVQSRKRNVNKKKTKQDDSDLDNIPVLYPCGICTKEVSDADDAILCEAGCEYWYHRMCTGMTDLAYQLLTNEENAEWVCDKCIATKSVPLVKIKSFEAIS